MFVSLIQTDIIWENKKANLEKLESVLSRLKGKTQLVVLPEMFSTGFSMNSHSLAETNEEETITTLSQWAQQYKLAICGSYIAKQEESYYNRGFLILPTSEKYFYDKHHLFRMGNEPKHFSAGHYPFVVHYQDFNICLLVCYDLRFPIWSRNVNNQYDLLIYVANWPASRQKVWDTLLRARALENMSYVCGVNRIGKDGNGLMHNGGSILISPKGETIVSIPDNKETFVTSEINIESLSLFRQKFPVWKDADKFTINE